MTSQIRILNFFKSGDPILEPSSFNSKYTIYTNNILMQFCFNNEHLENSVFYCLRSLFVNSSFTQSFHDITNAIFPCCLEIVNMDKTDCRCHFA